MVAQQPSAIRYTQLRHLSRAGRYRVLSAQDEAGHKLKEARIEGGGEGLARFFHDLEGPGKAVLEACWNWGLTHDRLEEIEEVILAHPLKTRLIADAQIKTDRLDACALGTLLRGNLVRLTGQFQNYARVSSRWLQMNRMKQRDSDADPYSPSVLSSSPHPLKTAKRQNN